MHVVCAVHDYPCNRVSGSARFARQLCRRLVARGHRVTVITSARARPAAYAAPDPGIHVQPIQRGPRNAWARQVRYPLRRVLGEDDFGLAGPLCSVIQRRICRARPDRVLAIAASTQEVVAAAQAARRLGIASVVVPFYHIHAPDFVATPPRWIEVLKSFDRVVAVTHEERGFLLRNGLAVERSVLTPMYVEPPEAVPAEEVARWRGETGVGDRLLVVAGGSYSPTKGAFALARASRSLPEARFVLFGGDEAGRRRLEAAVPVGSNVEFRGVVDDRERARLLHAADLLAMPSRGDSFGLLYIEANACGTPALAADLGSMREVLGPAGTFVPFGDDAALVRAIRSRAPEAWRKPEVVETARRNATRFTSAAALDAFVHAVEDAAPPEPLR